MITDKKLLLASEHISKFSGKQTTIATKMEEK
jgi:hypothetical protein